MKELIKINIIKIGDKEISSVDARDLHSFLEIKKRFTDWIRHKIKDYGFVINSDFCISHTKTENGRSIEAYIVSIDMAKELAMTSKTDKGKEARKYFIAMQNKTESILKKLETIDFKGNINDLMFLRNGRSVTSSRAIAIKFEKEHKNVIQAIERQLSYSNVSKKVEEFNRLNFQHVDYTDNKGELRKSYEITEEGFSLVILSFTGKRTLEFKIDFINSLFK